MYIYIQVYSEKTNMVISANSIAQGGGGSFKDKKLQERSVVVMQGWQSKSIDGPKGSWSCAFWSGCSGHLTHNCWMQCSGVQWQLQPSVVVVVVLFGVVVWFSLVELQLQLQLQLQLLLQCSCSCSRSRRCCRCCRRGCSCSCNCSGSYCSCSFSVSGSSSSQQQ